MSESSELKLRPIGVARKGMTALTGDLWGGVNSVIELDAERFAPNALAGLEAFSHVEVVFFHGLSGAGEDA